MPANATQPGNVRYEVLPFASVDQEAVAVGHPLTLTVTCSPRHGVDQTVEVARRLQILGHVVIVHLAARQVHSADHLDSILAQMAEGGAADVFLVGGDSSTPVGPYASALDLLPELRAHRLAPRSIGVAAYPEGHPLIDAATLQAALLAKGELADYMTTQLCFDASALWAWLAGMREAGVDLPAYVGIPGIVDSRRLLEVSMRVGVGASLSFLRKQRGIGHLFGRRRHAAAVLHRETALLIGGELGVAGIHFFTFNQLLATVRFAEGDVEVPSATATG